MHIDAQDRASAVANGIEEMMQGVSPQVEKLVRQGIYSIPYVVRDAVDDLYAAISNQSYGELRRALRMLADACEANEEYKDIYESARQEAEKAIGGIAEAEIDRQFADLAVEETEGSAAGREARESSGIIAKAEEAARRVISGNPTTDERAEAGKVLAAVAKVKRNEKIAAELAKKQEAMQVGEGGAADALVRAAIARARREAEQEMEQSEEEAEKGYIALRAARENAYRDVERGAKEQATAAVDKALVDLAKSVFVSRGKGDSLSGEADGIVSALVDYAEKRGVAYQPSEEVETVIAEVKDGENRLATFKESFQRAMEATGTDFQSEDIEYTTRWIQNLSGEIARRFENLRDIAEREKGNIDASAALAEAKESLGEGNPLVVEESEKGDKREKLVGEGAMKKIADLYRDWVEEEVPEWVNSLTPDECAKYADIMERARDWDYEENPDNLALEEQNAFEAKWGGRGESPEGEESSGEGEESNAEISDPSSYIADIYEEWVQEAVPAWVNTLSAEEATEYAALLDKARKHGIDEGSTAFRDLDAFEKEMSRRAGRPPRKAKSAAVEAKGEEKAKEAEKQPKEVKPEDKPLMNLEKAQRNEECKAAEKRLGVDAFRPDADMRRLWADAKRRADKDPRLEQRAKDIELILAEREERRRQPKREGAAGIVEDEMPQEVKSRIVMAAVLAALEN